MDSSAENNVGPVERVLSAAAGIGMIAMGLRKRPVASIIYSALGASLVYRGLSGQCAVYKALGLSTQSASANFGKKVEESIETSASPERLFKFARRVENLSMVIPGLVSAENEGQAHYRMRGRSFNSGITDFTLEIMNERENELIAWRALADGEIYSAGSLSFRQNPNQQTLLISEVSVVDKSASLREWIKSQSQQALVTLKAAVESQDASQVTG